MSAITKKTMAVVTTILLISLLLAVTASAHVVVYPKETVQGAYEKFTVRVPSEKDVPTVKVEVKFQTDAVDVSRFEPKDGWTYAVAKDATGKITGVTWTATGGGLSSTEFGEFNMQGKVADNASSITWKAYQTYKDGSVVEWTGASDSQTPASITVVKPKAAAGAATEAGGKPMGGGAGAAGSASSLPIYVAAAALAVSVISLLVSVARRKR